MAYTTLKRRSYKLDGQAVRAVLADLPDGFWKYVESWLTEDRYNWVGWAVIVLAVLMLAGQLIRWLI